LDISSEAYHSRTGWTYAQVLGWIVIGRAYGCGMGARHSLEPCLDSPSFLLCSQLGLGKELSNYRIITVAPNAEVAPYQERHGAIIHRRQVMQWLDGTVSETNLLETPPARTFLVEEIVDGPRQAALAL
jgi:hypothetical protein